VALSTLEGTEAAHAARSLARRRWLIVAATLGLLVVVAVVLAPWASDTVATAAFDGPPDLEVRVAEQRASLESNAFDWCDDHGRGACVSQDAEVPFDDVVFEVTSGSLLQVATPAYGDEGPVAIASRSGDEDELVRGPEGRDGTSFVLPSMSGRYDVTLVVPGSNGTPWYGLTVVVAASAAG
jgi:hypothetical protein